MDWAVLFDMLWAESEYLSLHVNGRPAALGCGPKYSAHASSSFSAGCGRKRTRQIGDELGGAFAVRRTAGLARWAFGPPGERAARTRQNWGSEWVLCFCGSQSRAGRSLPQRRLATGVALGPAGFDPLRQLHFLRLGCVSLRYRWRQTAVGQERLARFAESPSSARATL